MIRILFLLIFLSWAQTAKAAEVLPEMMGKIYQLGLAVAVLGAVLTIAFSGFQWATSRGEAGKISKAKGRIKDAIIGLSLAFLSVMILSSISPRFVDFDDINLEPITKKDLDKADLKDVASLDPKDYEGDSEASPINQKELDSCPVTTDVADENFFINSALASYLEPANIAQALSEKVRALDGTLVYNQASRTQKVVIKGKPYKTKDGRQKFYYDCSSYVAKLATCANLKLPSSNLTSDAIFPGFNCPGKTVILSPKSTNYSCENNNFYVEGELIPPGTIWGWGKKMGRGNGHLLMYIGNGKSTDCGSGGDKKSIDGNCIRVRNVCDHLKQLNSYDDLVTNSNYQSKTVCIYPLEKLAY